MVGFFRTAAAIKIKYFRSRELILMEKNTWFWPRSLTAKQLLHGEKGRKTANPHPESASGVSTLGGPLGARQKIGGEKQKKTINTKHINIFLTALVGQSSEGQTGTTPSDKRDKMAILVWN